MKPAINKGGRPKGATRQKVQLREAVKISLASLGTRALAGDWKAQEMLLIVASRSPELILGAAK